MMEWTCWMMTRILAEWFWSGSLEWSRNQRTSPGKILSEKKVLPTLMSRSCNAHQGPRITNKIRRLLILKLRHSLPHAWQHFLRWGTWEKIEYVRAKGIAWLLYQRGLWVTEVLKWISIEVKATWSLMICWSSSSKSKSIHCWDRKSDCYFILMIVCYIRINAF